MASRKIVGWAILIANLAIILALALLLGVKAQDTDTDSTDPFAVLLANTVLLDVVPHDLGTRTATRADLMYQYFEPDEDGFATFNINIYTITNYEVYIIKATTVSLAPGGTTTEVLLDELLEIKTLSLGGADDGPADNPTLQYSQSANWTDLPDSINILLFSGGNTEGGAINYHSATEGLRLDLAALGNNASGNVYSFTIIVTVVET